MKEPFGLENIGSTCYINTALQCLFSDPLFVKQLEPGACDPTSPLFSALCTLYNEPSKQNMHQFVRQLHKSLGKFMDFKTQNDMQEFLLLFLDEINKELKVNRNPNKRPHLKDAFADYLRKEWNRHHKDGQSWIVPHFHGQTITQIKCPSCNKIFHNAEVFTSLDLDVTANTLEQMIESHFAGDKIEGWRCDRCNSVANEIKRTVKATRLPHTLIVTLKRFGDRMSDHTHYPEYLVIPQPLHIYKQEIKYKLVAVGSHIGCSIGGHYFATTIRNEGKEYMVDDEAVGDEGVMREQRNAYVLFYTLAD